MQTLFLVPETWDLTLDVRGNIASASDIYQMAQDICSAGRTFTKDVYFNQDQGIPYFENILGAKGFPLSLYKKYLEDAALSIPGVESAQAIIQAGPERSATGAIVFSTETGQTGRISL